jgi:hypothetical protein
VNGFPVTVQARGAALSTCQAGGHHLGPARAGEGAAGDERSGCQPRRPGPATPAVARELRPGTGWEGRPGCRETADASASGQAWARRRGTDPGGPAAPGARSSRYCPAWNPIAVSCRPPVPATPVTPSPAGRQTAQQAADDVREVPRTPARDQRGAAVIVRAPGPDAAGQAAGHAGLASGLLTASQGDRPPCAR